MKGLLDLADALELGARGIGAWLRPTITARRRRVTSSPLPRGPASPPATATSATAPAVAPRVTSAPLLASPAAGPVHAEAPVPPARSRPRPPPSSARIIIGAPGVPRITDERSADEVLGRGTEIAGAAKDWLARVDSLAPLAAETSPPPAVTEKLCTKCGVTKPLSAFNRLTKAADGLAWQCRPCSRSALRSAVRTERVTARAVVARSELQEANTLMRCSLPQASDPAQAALRSHAVCGALVVAKKAALHLWDVHGKAARPADAAKYFEAVKAA